MDRHQYYTCISTRVPEIPIPVYLDVEYDVARHAIGRTIELLYDHVVVATMDVHGMYALAPEEECNSVYGTDCENHPGVAYIRDHVREYAITGPLVANMSGIKQVLQNMGFGLPMLTPDEVREHISGYEHVVAFQTRNPMHKAHVALVRNALASVRRQSKAIALVHPTLGHSPQEGDVSAEKRARAYMAVDQYLPHPHVLCGLPLGMRMAGPREAAFHALVRMNYGATHFIVGRDHAGPSAYTVDGSPFYGAHDAQEYASEHVQSHDLPLKILPSPELVYDQSINDYVSKAVAVDPCIISGRKLRAMLAEGSKILDYISYPEVVAALQS